MNQDRHPNYFKETEFSKFQWTKIKKKHFKQWFTPGDRTIQYLIKYSITKMETQRCYYLKE